MPEAVERTSGRWAPGVSGNPRGRPRDNPATWNLDRWTKTRWRRFAKLLDDMLASNDPQEHATLCRLVGKRIKSADSEEIAKAGLVLVVTGVPVGELGQSHPVITLQPQEGTRELGPPQGPGGPAGPPTGGE